MVRVPHTSQLFEEDEQIAAVCPELNVSSFGDTSEQAGLSLQEAVTVYLEECLRMKTLESVREQAGYRRNPDNPQAWVRRKPIATAEREAAVA
jgi:predicted RNase H-like HicB family nuclease